MFWAKKVAWADSILDQRKYYSPYVFEETAEKLLHTDEDLRKEFEDKKQNDDEFAQNAYTQLRFIYERSPNFEADYRLYPVMRIME